MSGYKTWIGAILMIAATGVQYAFPQYAAIGDAMMRIGEVFGIVGIAHKVEKAGK
jgi:hypothetical protein